MNGEVVYYKQYYKGKWIIIDSNYYKILGPNEELLNIAILGEPPKRCCTCGSGETYIYPDGRFQWHGHKCKKENCTGSTCHECYKVSCRVDVSETNEYILHKRKGRKCSKCGTDLYIGEDYGRRYYDNKGYFVGFICRNCNKINKSETKEYLLLKRKNRRCCRCNGDSTNKWHGHSCDNIGCTGWLCHKCWHKIDHLWRNGSLDKYSNDGKAVVSQWIVAKTINLLDKNIENDNFRETIDLTYHPVYKRIDVKSATLFGTVWEFSGLIKDCDTFIFVCMDKLWEKVDRVYIIPEHELYGETYIEIYKYVKEWYEESRIDDKSYNDKYNSVDIPEFFSPIDLWNGKYDRKR